MERNMEGEINNWLLIGLCRDMAGLGHKSYNKRASKLCWLELQKLFVTPTSTFKMASPSYG